MILGAGSGHPPAEAGGMRSGLGGRGRGGLENPPPELSSLLCSICLEHTYGNRSIARLQCGHVFHLDCIGSAFNAKRMMQCPICRNVENGRWFFAGGTFAIRGISIQGWTDNDISNVNSSEMLLYSQWIPFTGVFQLIVSSGGVENSWMSNSQALLENHYSPYPGQLVVSGALTNASVYDYNVNHIAGLTQVHNAHAFPNVDQYLWQHDAGYTTQNSSTIHGDHTRAYPAAPWVASDDQTRRESAFCPFLLRESPHSAARGRSSFAPVVSSYAGNNWQLTKFDDGDNDNDDDDIPEWQPPYIPSYQRNQTGFYQPPPGASTWQAAQGIENSGGSTGFNMGMGNSPVLNERMQLEHTVNGTDGFQMPSRMAFQDQHG